MQEGIHPEYGPVVFYDRSADKYFLTKSTLVAKAVNLPTIDWEDGNTYPLVNVEVSSEQLESAHRSVVQTVRSSFNNINASKIGRASCRERVSSPV